MDEKTFKVKALELIEGYTFVEFGDKLGDWAPYLAGEPIPLAANLIEDNQDIEVNVTYLLNERRLHTTLGTQAPNGTDIMISLDKHHSTHEEALAVLADLNFHQLTHPMTDFDYSGLLTD